MHSPLSIAREYSCAMIPMVGGTAMQTIQELRKSRGWTQLQLANTLGVTPVTVYNWERGRHEPKASQLRALAKVFGVSMDEIDFEGQGKPAGEGSSFVDAG